MGFEKPDRDEGKIRDVALRGQEAITKLDSAYVSASRERAVKARRWTGRIAEDAQTSSVMRSNNCSLLSTIPSGIDTKRAVFMTLSKRANQQAEKSQRSSIGVTEKCES
jgi:hypothetical protein